jgi:hypothetical protein
MPVGVNPTNRCYLEFTHHQVVLIYIHIAIIGWICHPGLGGTKEHETLM